MTIARRNFLKLAASAAALPVLPRAAAAETFPSRPIHIVAGFAAGSASDINARLLGQWLSERLGQPVIVDNRSGAGGNLASEVVVRAPADGYTLLYASTAIAINETLYAGKLSFNAQKDLTPVAGVVRTPVVMEVNKDLPIKTVAEFIAYAKANPGKLTYGSPGNGSTHQLSAELMKQVMGIDILHVPYKGVVQMATAIMAGEIDMAFMGYTAAIPAVQKGSARIFGVSTAQRIPSLPNIPTLQEAGIKGLPISTSMGFLGPVNLPRDLNIKFVKAITVAVQSPEVVAKFQDLGLVPAMQSGDAFTASIRSDMVRYGDIIKRANIKAE